MEIEINKKLRFKEGDFLWRYLDIQKLFSFILDKKLFFSRLDKFNDPLEGLTEEVLGHIAHNDGIPDNEGDLNPSYSNEEKSKILKERNDREMYIKEKIDLFQKSQFANCWFVGKKESFAMWNLYSDINSVAIRYNPEELIELVVAAGESYNHDDFKKLLYGFVDYDDIWPFNFFEGSKTEIKYTAFKKDLSYEHEREFRFVSLIPKRSVGRHNYFELPFGDITLDNFKIFANPYMQSWKFNNLMKILEKFSLNNKFVRSKLRVKNER